MTVYLSHLVFSFLFGQRRLASLLNKLGVVKGALEIYERLQMWDDIIGCLVLLGRHGEVGL